MIVLFLEEMTKFLWTESLSSFAKAEANATWCFIDSFEQPAEPFIKHFLLDSMVNKDQSVIYASSTPKRSIYYDLVCKLPSHHILAFSDLVDIPESISQLECKSGVVLFDTINPLISTGIQSIISQMKKLTVMGFKVILVYHSDILEVPNRQNILVPNIHLTLAQHVTYMVRLLPASSLSVLTVNSKSSTVPPNIDGVCECIVNKSAGSIARHAALYRVTSQSVQLLTLDEISRDNTQTSGDRKKHEPLSSFNLVLDEGEKQKRAQVVLPFMKAQQNTNAIAYEQQDDEFDDDYDEEVLFCIYKKKKA